MIAWDKILSELVGVVGWRQSTVQGDVIISDENLASSSNLFVQGAHPIVTVKNIKATQEDRQISDDQMNDVLMNLMKDGVSNVLNYVFPSSDIFANGLLYKYESDFNYPLTELKGFVGYEICVANRPDVVSVLNKIILQFSGAGSVKLLLFNSGVKAPISSKTVTVTANTNITAIVDWLLGYVTAPGGNYYVGYLNNSLNIYAYNRAFSRSNYMTEFKSILFKPIYVKDWNTETLFNLTDIVYRSETFGLNFDVTTAKDYSNIILQNKDRFAKAIQLSTAANALALMTTTSRVNPEERVVISAIGQKIVIDSPASFNLYNALDKELKSLTQLFGQKQITSGTLR